MYTHFFWLFDYNNRLFYDNSFCAASLADAYGRMGMLLQKDKRLAERGGGAVKVYCITVLTSLLSAKPALPPADADFCLACAQLNLTSAETNLLLLVRLRKSYKEMADHIRRSPNTVKKHLSNAFVKLGVNDQGEALGKIENQVKAMGRGISH